MPSDHFIPQPTQNSRDVPIPTIEVSDSPTQPTVLQPAPIISSRPRGSPPRTPVPQILQDNADEDTTMDSTDMRSQGESISRPSTACSGFSDSSVSSSIESFPSLGGSFTSPECDVQDHQHKASSCANGKRPIQISAVASHGLKAIPRSSQTAPSKHPCTEDMDNHLWMTYMRYLQDPRHTPFKMLPGIPPPLGVCSRVAREAKRTWKGPRARAISRAPRLTPYDQMLQADSPDTIRPTHSGSATPTGSHIPKRQNSWPRSDASTRRRLRELCKMKPTLSAHYNRLLVTRSPSPFLSSSSSCLGSNVNDGKANMPSFKPDMSFSTRDMSLSLFSSTSSAVSAMNQFTADSATPKPLAPAPYIAPNARYNGHQKSQSLHLNMGMGLSYANREGLASPFQPFQKTVPVASLSSHTGLQTPMAPIPQLASPLQFAAPMQPPRYSLKHYLGNDESSDADLNSQNAPFPDFDARYSALAGRRVRNRAVSMGDVSASSRRLSLMFEPPTGVHIPPLPQSSTGTVPTINAPSLHPPSLGSFRRLGSPFAEKPPRPLFNTFPRNFSLHGLEPTLESQEERQTGNDNAMLSAFGDGPSLPKIS
jgi:hypothetical protein